MAWRERATFGIAIAHGVFQSLPANGVAYTVATAPPAATHLGGAIFMSNGAGGNPCWVFSDGTNWLRCDTLATAAAA